MKKSLLCCLIILSFSLSARTIKLNNGLIERVFYLSDDSKLSTSSYMMVENTVKNEVKDENWTLSKEELKNKSKSFINPNSKEFAFTLDDKEFTGLSAWSVSVRDTTISGGGKGYVFLLKSTEKEGLNVSLTYLTFPNLPLIKKQLTIYNSSLTDFKLESLDVENLNLNLWTFNAWIMRNYARYKHIGPYIGDWDDPLVIVHDVSKQRGMAIGNEAIGVLKRTAIYEKGGQGFSAGLTHTDQNFAFRKWIPAGQSWESPAVFTALYSNSNNPYDVINSTVSDYTRKYMGSRIEVIKKKPMFVYNTWFPFKFDINHDLIIKLADAASECGIEEFVIDDGWQTSYGDWTVNPKKFPYGLTSTFDYIKQKGMKPGLWLSIARADTFTNVYKKHPEWFVKDKNDQFCNLHSQAETVGKTACMSTDWKDYIKNTILKLVNENGLAYAKLDFAVVTSPYLYKPEISGCYAANHPLHSDHAASYDVMYNGTMTLFDELHKSAPDLFIDCSFETAGRLNMSDYTIVKHAEGNWLSNIYEPGEIGALRARLLAWQRTPALPASTLVIGNLRMNDPERELMLKSLAGTLPILLGDPTKLTSAERQSFKTWVDWLKGVENRHAYMSFRQDLPGFGEPTEGCWDGFMRINTETKSGGLVGVFRQGGAETIRTITVKYLDFLKKYAIKEGKTGKLISTMTGKQLEETGFKVTLLKKYDSQLFEIVAK